MDSVGSTSEGDEAGRSNCGEAVDGGSAGIDGGLRDDGGVTGSDSFVAGMVAVGTEGGSGLFCAGGLIM